MAPLALSITQRPFPATRLLVTLTRPTPSSRAPSGHLEFLVEVHAPGVIFFHPRPRCTLVPRSFSKARQCSSFHAACLGIPPPVFFPCHSHPSFNSSSERNHVCRCAYRTPVDNKRDLPSPSLILGCFFSSLQNTSTQSPEGLPQAVGDTAAASSKRSLLPFFPPSPRPRTFSSIIPFGCAPHPEPPVYPQRKTNPFATPFARHYRRPSFLRRNTQAAIKRVEIGLAKRTKSLYLAYKFP